MNREIVKLAVGYNNIFLPISVFVGFVNFIADVPHVNFDKVAAYTVGTYFLPITLL